jgi:hypothetical protein
MWESVVTACSTAAAFGGSSPYRFLILRQAA